MRILDLLTPLPDPPWAKELIRLYSRLHTTDLFDFSKLKGDYRDYVGSSS